MPLNPPTVITVTIGSFCILSNSTPMRFHSSIIIKTLFPIPEPDPHNLVIIDISFRNHALLIPIATIPNQMSILFLEYIKYLKILIYKTRRGVV